MSSHFAASTIAEICSLRITYERLKSNENGKNTREGIWRIRNSGKNTREGIWSIRNSGC
jgi:hypothetical protein